MWLRPRPRSRPSRKNSACRATWRPCLSVIAGFAASWSIWMTGPSSRYQASGRRARGPVCLPLVPRLTAAVPCAQESQQLVPPGPLGPLTLPQWDEDQQLGGLKESLSQLCALLLEEGAHPGVPAQAADLGSVGKTDPRPLLAPLGPAVCPTGGGKGVSCLAPHECSS